MYAVNRKTGLEDSILRRSVVATVKLTSPGQTKGRQWLLRAVRVGDTVTGASPPRLCRHLDLGAPQDSQGDGHLQSQGHWKQCQRKHCPPPRACVASSVTKLALPSDCAVGPKSPDTMQGPWEGPGEYKCMHDKQDSFILFFFLK